MKKLKLTALFVASLFVFACSNPEKEADRSETEVIAHDQNHSHEEGEEALHLNNGQKWVVNDEMKPFVANGKSLVDEYIASHDTNYVILASQLTGQNNQLINSCTMKGEDHDALHLWLHPHLDLVEELSEAKSAEAAKPIVDKLDKSYKTYYEYFQ